MKKLPVKWKVFLVFNYLQLVSFGLALLALITFFIKDKPRGPDSLYHVLAGAGLLLICLNNFLNIYAVHHYFPDTLIPRGNKVLRKIVGVISILLFTGLLCFFIYGLNEELSIEYDYEGRDQAGMHLVIILFFLLVFGIYTLILQFRIFRFLRRNNAIKMSLLINSIGNQ